MIISQELKAAEDPEFETFYTKNILLNEGNTTLEWLSKIKLMKIISSQKRYCQEVILCESCFSYQPLPGVGITPSG